MKTIRSLHQMRAWSTKQWQADQTVGFVPTMGFLHAGHSALVRRAKKENDAVVVSIFVNPAQFGPTEDFKKYPRNLKKDLALLKKEKVDVVFVPSSQAMYPSGLKATIKAGPISKPLEGQCRPGHFDGVCTIVAKLFDLVQPNRAYFGQKDFQQTLVVKDLVHRFKLPIQIVVCPTVREKDGLAMSSRNVHLSPEERALAPVIYQSLRLAKNDLLVGEPVGKVQATALGVLTLTGFNVQYFSVCDAEKLTPIRDLKKAKGKRLVIAVAAYLGKTRLIDHAVFLV